MKYFHLIVSLLSFFSAFGQGVECAIPYDPEVVKLTQTNILPGQGILIAKNLQEYKSISYWNLPVCFDDGFNYFAANKNFINSCNLTANGDYLFLNESDSKFSAYPKENFWSLENKPIGNNRVKLNGTEFQLNARLPIYVIESRAHFYKNLGSSYNDVMLKATGSYQTLAAYLTEKIKESNYITDGVKFHLEGTIDFKDSVDIKLNTTLSTNVTLSTNAKLFNSVNTHISDWSNLYKPISLVGNYPIFCKKYFTITVEKEIELERKFISEIDGNELKNASQFKKIFESEIQLPKRTFCNLEISTVNITIDAQSETDQKIFLQHVYLPRLVNLYPLLAFTGVSHYLVVKKNYRKRIIPTLTIGSAGIFALAWGAKEIFYNRYLQQPNERVESYKIANTSYQIMKAALITYSIGVGLDVYKTCRTIKKLTRLVHEVNPKL